jgi:hypothetical protein
MMEQYNPEDDSAILCTKHKGKQIAFFCQQHKEILCIDCKADHYSHSDEVMPMSVTELKLYFDAGLKKLVEQKS